MNLWQTVLKNSLNDLKHTWQGLLIFIASLKGSEASYTPPGPTQPMDPNNSAPKPINQPAPHVTVPQTLPPKYDWSNPTAARHSLRVICDEEGLTFQQKNDLSRTIHCESGYYIHAKHPNVVNGKVTSTDWGMFQINDFYHIGPGKDFPSVDFVVNNPEPVTRWMCKMVKENKLNLWVCWSSGLAERYEP